MEYQYTGIDEIRIGKNRVLYVPVFEDEQPTAMKEFLSSEVRISKMMYWER